jgi:FMN-dependent NADH-azoreductase
LQIDSSSRYAGSTTRRLTQDFVDKFTTSQPSVDVVERDLAEGLPFISEDWISANFTPLSERSADQRARLAHSDSLVKELEEADILVIGVPIYNFSVPASLKAWIDLVARVGLTFKYTETGPVGLLEGKKAYIMFASGGTTIGSDIDFASGYLQHVLGFIGVHDVDLITTESWQARQSEFLDYVPVSDRQLNNEIQMV